ncbi:MAG TPA: hypothetical protein VIY08_14895 [Candidatus Nitrosocosmicus sp.]
MSTYFHLPYRQTEGIVQGHTKGKVPSIPNYITINIRINKLNVKIRKMITKTRNLKMNTLLFQQTVPASK